MSLWVCTNPDCGTLTGPDPILSASCPRCGSATAFFNGHAAASMPRASTSLKVDPPSPVPATLSELLTEEWLWSARVDAAGSGRMTERLHALLLEKLQPAWDARERRIASAEAKVTQLAKDQMMLASAIVTDAEKLSEPMWTPPSLAERAREHGRDAAKLREAEAAREALSNAVREFGRALEPLSTKGTPAEVKQLGLLWKAVYAALSPVPSSPRE